MMPLRLIPAAREEMQQAAAYYEDQREGLGEEFLAELKQTAARIQAMPNGWAKVSARCRRCQLNRFPYGLIYAVLEDEILVLAVMHLSRRPDYWRRREPR